MKTDGIASKYGIGLLSEVVLVEDSLPNYPFIVKAEMIEGACKKGNVLTTRKEIENALRDYQNLNEG